MGKTWVLIAGAIGLIVVLVAWPIRIGFEAYNYQSAAAFVASGSIVGVFDGVTNKQSRFEVTYDGSPESDAAGKRVEFDVRYRTTWDDPYFTPSIVLLGAMARGFQSCVADGQVIASRTVSRDDLSALQRAAATSILTEPEANGDLPATDDTSAQGAWERLESTDIIVVEPLNSDPWVHEPYTYAREADDVETSFDTYQLAMTCAFDPPTVWQSSETARVLNFPTVIAATNANLGEAIVSDNQQAEAAVEVNREARLKSHQDWALSSTTSTSNLGTDGYRTFTNGWNSYDGAEESLSSTGFAAMFTDRRAEANQRTQVFVAGVAAGVAAALAVSVMKNIVLLVPGARRRP